MERTRRSRSRLVLACLAAVASAAAVLVPSGPAQAGVADNIDVYVQLTPCRIVDTRLKGGAFDDREIREYTVSGSGDIFANQGGKAGGCEIPFNATAIEASITAVDPTDSGFFRAWPSGQSMPNATFLNFDKGMDITNTGSIPISNGGIDLLTGPRDIAGPQLKVRNFGGHAHYVIDVQGYWVDISQTSSASLYTAITPCRIVDTRKGWGDLTDREIRTVTVSDSGAVLALQGGNASGCDIPSDAVAIEASVTAIDETDSGFFRAWPSGQSMPNATFLNFDKGMDITNTGTLTIKPLEGGAKDGGPAQLTIRNFGGDAHYVIDVQGFFTPLFVSTLAEAAASAGPAAPSIGVAVAGYRPITPCRILDTRLKGGPLGDREIRDITVTFDALIDDQGGKAGGCGIPGGITAIEASITAVDPTDSGFFRAWPFGESMPNATFLNFDKGMDITNTGSVTVNSVVPPSAEDIQLNGGSSDELRIRNFGGTAHYVIDVQGYYEMAIA